MLTNDEIRNIVALINRAQITGVEAEAVAVVKQKLLKMLEEEIKKEE